MGTRGRTNESGAVSDPARPPGLPAASVVICAYTERRWANLIAAVRSVGAQTAGALECIVVVDHNPALLAMARRRFPEAVVVPNTERRGLSGARNTGAGRSLGDVVAFLDDDAAAEPDWLAQLLRPYADPRVIGTSGVALAEWARTRPAWFPREFDWVVGCSYRGLPEEEASVRNVMGAAMSFRRDVFDRVGWFSVDVGRVGAVPLGCEETEFSIRALQRIDGARLVHVPTARVHHSVGAERARIRYFVRRCYAEGISKAAVARVVGASSATATERRYATRVLPSGFAGGLARTARGDIGGLARSGMIAAGLAVTTAGYVAGRVRPGPSAAGTGAPVAAVGGSR